MTKRNKSKKGSVLILALWTVIFLSFFALYIGLRIRQRAILLSRLEDRSQLHYAAEAGIKKAIAALRLDWQRHNQRYSSYGKFYRHNNQELFHNISVGPATCDVFAQDFPAGALSAQIFFGFVDEERKININTAERTTLKKLIENIISSEERAKQLANAIVGWREQGKTELVGFYSDEYYSNLKYPYEPKNGPFELMDELLLIRGMNQDLYEKLLPFVTIYGEGRVNVNTAPREVLLALGLEEDVIDKIFLVRRGFDGVEATVDDYIFHKTYDIASEIKSFVKLEPKEMKQIDRLNALKKIDTNSFYYRMQSQARLKKPGAVLSTVCIYNMRENRIEYWHEK